MTEPSVHYATLWETIADRIPELPALQCGDREVSWSSFEQRSARLAAALRSHGIGHGHVVGAFLYNCPEYFEIFFGALKARAVPANINYRYTSDELLALVANAEARVLFFDAALRDRVASIAGRAPELLLVEVGSDIGSAPPVSGAHAYEELLAAAEPADRIQRDGDDVFLSYTGGTTGLPKGVLMRIGQSAGNSFWFRDLFFGERPVSSPLDYVDRLVAEGSPASAIPASPLMHSTGLIFASLPTLCAGGQVTTLRSRSFDAHELLATVASTKAQVVALVGDAFGLPIVRALDAGCPGGGRYDVGSLRVLCSAGVAWSAQIKERLLDHVPRATLVDSCGATEGLAYGLSQIRRGDQLSTVNFTAAPGLKVLSPQGRELPTGEVGLLAGPTTASGYHREPEKSAAVFRVIDGQQYAIPGDLGRVEADGTVTLIGRGFSTINTGGEKVFPTEVEEAIRALPAVDDCLVLGVPDGRFGQAVAALVVRDEVHPVDADDVAAVVRRSLAGYKVPRHIRFVDRVPRLPNGKVDFETAGALVASADVAGVVLPKT